MADDFSPALDPVFLGDRGEQGSDLALAHGEPVPNWGLGRLQFGDEAAGVQESVSVRFAVSPFCPEVQIKGLEIASPQHAATIIVKLI